MTRLVPAVPTLACLALLLAGASPAHAELTIGAILSLTGPGAALGIPERDTIPLLPTAIAGQPIRWIVLDDASDTTAAVKAARKLIDDEHVDAIIGASTTPASLAILDTVAAAGVPTISLAAAAAVIEPPDGPRRWAFKLLPGETVAATQIVAHMQATGTKTLAQIGFNNALGDGYIKALTTSATAAGIRTIAEARYNPQDTAVTPQILRLLATRPDAVFVAAASTPATTPILELRARGYTGPIYTVQAIADPDALRVGGAALDGTMFPAVPVLVAEQLPDTAPVKAPALAFVAAYEGKYGPGTRSLSGATLWDAVQLAAAATPAALVDAQPGTPKFRAALRNAMESVHGLAGAEAVFTLSPTDHGGAQPDSQVMVEIRNGAYRLLPPPTPPGLEAAAPPDIPPQETPADTPPVDKPPVDKPPVHKPGSRP